ncbi:MAG: formylglycine-generating enzyme family protein [Alphaproteobacteria bacterium]|nr:formylglycine-generating enzyme family protein [Alphaproteobacteria bacterium]
MPSFQLLTDCERLTFSRITQSDCGWADAIGRDRFGLWAEIVVGDARQRLRWIPPGQFLMGSPEDEPGRFENEGPRHGVTISQGYWLFDTPCTQRLWQAVMGDNPSRFRSPDRPVERVSWTAVGDFLTRVNDKHGVGLALPSEAQWEYACRAGTTTALHTGPIAILGANNAPALDPIAWYGGNSGVDFNLPEGHDNKGWHDKQYPHEKAGTHPVRLKRPNDWGLHDMLGNVWEWCADGPREYGTEATTDPLGSLEAGAVRVIRGGSWSDVARSVRAAACFRLRPAVRNDGLGFRCARVQG